MTIEDKREKEIDDASEKFVAFNLCDTKFTEEAEDFIQYCFGSGAQWADENPQFRWISVNDDLPCNHEDLLESENYTKKVLAVLEWEDDPSEKHIEVCDMCNIIGSFTTGFYWRKNVYYNVTHWMRLPELPKK